MITKIKPKIFQLHFNKFGSCVYILQLNNKNILIDTSSQFTRTELLKDLKQLKIKPEQIQIIILTHNHWDHNANINLFPNAQILNNKNEKEIEKLGFKFIKTPGHTKDSISLLYQDILFSGDTLFNDGIGRTDFPESQPKKMQESLDKLKKLDYDILCPGHIN